MFGIRRKAALGAALMSVLLATASAHAVVLFGATGTGDGIGTLVTIDPTNGTPTVIGALNDASGGNYRVTGLAFHPATGILFGSANNRSPTNPNSLVRIDPATALVTFIVDFVPPPVTDRRIADLTFRPDGTLFGWAEPGTDDLVTINLATGALSVVGDSGLETFGSGLASDTAGILYFAGSGAGGLLHTIDATTGAATAGPTLTNAPIDSGISALAFGPDGTLFGANLASDDDGSAHLVSIDTTTGVITDRGRTIDRLDAIAWSVDIVQVPEPALASLFAAGLIGLALARRRRRG